MLDFICMGPVNLSGAHRKRTMKNTKELMHCHCDTNNRAPRWTFTDPCKPKVKPGAREELASPAWLAASAMNARDKTKVDGGLTLDVDRHYIGNVTATTHLEKGIISLESNPSQGTLPPAQHGKGNRCDKNVKYFFLIRFLTIYRYPLQFIVTPGKEWPDNNTYNRIIKLIIIHL